MPAHAAEIKTPKRRNRLSNSEKLYLYEEWKTLKKEYTQEEAAGLLDVPPSTFWYIVRDGDAGTLSSGSSSSKVRDNTAWKRNLPLKKQLDQLEEATMKRLVKARRHRQQLLLREIRWHAKRAAKKAGLLWKTWVWHNKAPFKLGNSWARSFVHKKELQLASSPFSLQGVHS